LNILWCWFFRNYNKEYQFYLCTCWLQQWGDLNCTCEVRYTCGRCYAMPISAGEKLWGFYDSKYVFLILFIWSHVE